MKENISTKTIKTTKDIVSISIIRKIVTITCGYVIIYKNEIIY